MGLGPSQARHRPTLAKPILERRDDLRPAEDPLTPAVRRAKRFRERVITFTAAAASSCLLVAAVVTTEPHGFGEGRLRGLLRYPDLEEKGSR